ncbi:MAG: GH39 family glycosyl hydrolase [Acidobacteriaceae bacterium]
MTTTQFEIRREPDRSAYAWLGRCFCGLILAFSPAMACLAQAAAASAKVTVDWDKTILVSRSTPTFQVVVNPMLDRGSSIHDAAFGAIRQLGAEEVRYVPWLPYPRLAVAELQPPTPTGTSWNFDLIDPMMEDFMTATSGHSTIVNFSTIPAWLFKTPQPITYPKDPNQAFWDYTQGSELADPSGKALGDYYARLVGWYTRGGFTDENGEFHASTHHYKFPMWEVLNEVDSEHRTTPEQYTARYDAIVSAIHKVSPETQFMGLALGDPSANPHWFEYFLDHANHRAGIPLDYISYHFYASPAPGETIDDWQYSFFNQADRFLTAVRFINQIRDRLSPETKTDTDELGVILPNDNDQVAEVDGYVRSIPSGYWNAAGALYAYLYINLAKLGVDIIGESQLVGYPSQYPSVTMVDWVNGKPNARYWVLKLIKDNFHPGDKIVETTGDSSDGVTAQAFQTQTGRKLLLVNQRNRSIEVKLPQSTVQAESSTVDESTDEGPPRTADVTGPMLRLAPFAVTVVRWSTE